MISTIDLENIAISLPIFKEIEKKEKFLFVLGALTARVISLRKAAEVMDLDEAGLLQILDLLGIEFSYLEAEDIRREKEW